MTEIGEHPRAHGGSSRGAQISVRRVRDLILAAIRSGELATSATLNEEQLMSAYSASRGAVRGALSQLTSLGMLERRTRVGTKVVDAGVRFGVTDFGLSDFGGITISILEQRVVPTTPFLQQRLQLEDTHVRMVENAFHLRGETIGIRTAYFSQDVTADPTALLGPLTMADILREFFASEPGDVYVWIGAETSDARTSRILDIPEGSALLRREVTYLDIDHRPIQIVFDAFRADRVSLDRGPVPFA